MPIPLKMGTIGAMTKTSVSPQTDFVRGKVIYLLALVILV